MFACFVRSASANYMELQLDDNQDPAGGTYIFILHGQFGARTSVLPTLVGLPDVSRILC